MKKTLLFVLILGMTSSILAQTYAEKMVLHRTTYVNDLLGDAENKGVIEKKDILKIKFYDAKESYIILASFKATPEAKPFEMSTHSGKMVTYRKYGELSFEINKKQYQLAVYQNQKFLTHPIYKTYLFLPFNDATNGEDTYGGGRYIDLKLEDIVNNQITLDFNKCYNPYCAYAEGYACPIPPAENKLKVEILAGEKVFEK